MSSSLPDSSFSSSEGWLPSYSQSSVQRWKAHPQNKVFFGRVGEACVRVIPLELTRAPVLHKEMERYPEQAMTTRQRCLDERRAPGKIPKEHLECQTSLCSIA